MSENKDIILRYNFKLKIENGDFSIGDSEMQEVGLIITMNQGELKSDPLLGVGLIQMIKSKANRLEIDKKVKLHLQRDGKEFNRIKDKINIKAILQ